MKTKDQNLRRLDIARRLISGEKRAFVAESMNLRKEKVRHLCSDGIRICQLYCDPPVTHHVTLSDARNEADKFIKAIDFAVIAEYLK